MTQETQEVTTEQSQQIWDIRQAFQDTITKGAWTLTETESEELLSSASLPVILQAIQNLQVYLRQKNQEASQYMPDELIQRLEKEMESTVKVQEAPKQFEQTRKIKRSRYASHEDLKAELGRRLGGQALTDAELTELHTASGHRPMLLLQAARNTSKHVIGVTTHEFALQKLHSFLHKEISKMEHAMDKRAGARKNASTNTPNSTGGM